MEKSKLIQILRLFDRSELLAAHYYVRGCCAVQRTKAGDLLAILLVFIKKDIEIDKKKVFVKVFGKETPYDVNLLGRYMHELLVMLEDFIVLNEKKRDASDSTLILSRFAANKNNVGLGIDYFEAAKNKLDTQAQRDISHFETKQTHENYAIFLGELQHQNIFDYQPLTDTIYISAIANILRLHCKLQNEYLSNKRMLPDDQLFKIILDYLGKNEFTLKVPTIGIYYYLYKVLSDFNLENYAQFKSVLLSYQHFFSPEEVSKLYVFLENSFVLQIAQNKIDYHSLFDLYKTGYENSFIYDFLGNIAVSRLQNVITVALRTNEAAWAVSFLADCKSRIAEENREEVYEINLATIQFEQGKFEAVQTALDSLKYTTIAYQLTARRLQIKLYYVTDSNDALDFALRAYLKFLYATKKVITENYKQNNLAFVRTARQLFELRDLPKRSRRKTLDKLITEISTKMHLAERPWLAKQAEILTL